MKKEIILLGGGGHGKVVIDAILNTQEFKIYGIVDPQLPPGSSILDIPVAGGDDILPVLFRKGVRYAFIGVGSVGNCDARKKMYHNLKKIGFILPVIIHPKAIVARDVAIGEGTFVAAGAVINAGTKVGKNVIINTSSSIDHDCMIGDFVHIAPGATLSGGVKVGDETHIGTGVNIIQCLNIGKQAFIPAGKTVIRDLADKERYK